tara:strand:+ start:19548 stop:21134 length:1587 start_codon:yes stop_codon:yes gene_type:complete
MGIPSYFSHIVREHRKIIKEYNANRMAIHNLYMDCNSLIYEAVRGIKYSKNNYEFLIIKEVCNKIKSYIELLKPSEHVYIAFDGVAPVAKLQQQRNRRYKSRFQNKLLKNLDVETGDSWDTVAITPGTKFMENLGQTIENRFKNIKEFHVKKIIVSTSKIHGEGEHKIYQYIRDHPTHHSNTTTVIYGLDADLIMLTLNHLSIAPSMYLFRETPHFIKSIDKTLNPCQNYVLDLPEFGRYLACELNDGNEPTTQQRYDRIFDYIFLCFFLGNDFLPHFPALNIRTSGIDRLLSVYRKTFGKTNENLVKGSKIIWKNVRKMLLELAKDERDMICAEHRIRDRQSSSLMHRKLEGEDGLLAIPMIDRRKENYINPYEKGWESRYYQTLFDTHINDMRRKQISINYLEGLEWTLKYYTTGCANWRWGYKYDYPPLLSDLVKYIPYFDTELVSNTDPGPINELVQLSYVLPGDSLYLLPPKIHDLLLKNNRNWYSDHEFCWAYCKYFWEAHAKMPEIDIEKLEQLVMSKTNK